MIDLRLTLIDSPVGNVPVKIRCKNPEHRDSRASCAVYADGIFCFGCGIRIGTGRRGEEAFKFLLGKMPEDLTKYTVEGRESWLRYEKSRAEADPLLDAIATAFHTFLVAGRRYNRLPWLYERGLNYDTLALAQIGHDGSRFSIPIYDRKGSLVSIRYRRDDFYGLLDIHEREIDKYVSHPGRDNSMHLYPEWLLACGAEPFGQDFIVVTEGELDALLLIQHGIPAITMTNGAGRIKHVPEFLVRAYPHITKIYGATDMDLVGGQSEAELSVACLVNGLRYEGIRWSNKFKDVTELYQAGGCLVVSSVGAIVDKRSAL